jgi:tRNA A22 N-methylase
LGLSKRLSALKSQAQASASIWDIGCDHGLLGLSFENDPNVQSIHLVDPSDLVINTLRTKLKDSDITRIKILHNKGQNVKVDSLQKTIFIAGMGGKEIKDILLNLEAQLTSADQVVISPHRNILLLREYLMESPWRLKHESVVFEDEQFYLMMDLSLKSNLPKVSPYGTDLWTTDIGQAYLNQQLRHFSAHQDQVSQRYLKYLESVKLRA